MVFSPVEESPFASVVGERPKDLPGDTDVDMRSQADGNESIQVLLGREGPCTHAQGSSRTEIGVVPFVVSGKPKVRLETVFLMIGEDTWMDADSRARYFISRIRSSPTHCRLHNE